jgi:hypothetical protein
MELTEHGLKKPDNDDFYNIQDFNENTTVIEAHLSDKESHVISSEIADIVEPGALTKIGSGDNNSTIWGKIKKAISVILDHIGNVATATTAGHIKIGTGLQMSSGTASVKIANNLTTNDSTTALSAAMGVQMNTNFTIQIGTITPNNVGIRLVKYGRLCIVSGIYSIPQDLGTGMYSMGRLSQPPIYPIDLSIVSVASTQSVAGGYIGSDGSVYYQIASPVPAGLQLRVFGVYITN